MYISFSRRRPKNFLIVSINATSDHYFKRLVENYQSEKISFVTVSAEKFKITGNSTFYIPVRFIVAIWSWCLLFRYNETKRLKLELKLYYFSLSLLHRVLNFRSVFLYGDRHGFAEPAALKLCAKYGLNSYVIAVARSSGISEFFNKLDRLSQTKIAAHIVRKSDGNVRVEHQICDVKTRTTFSFYPRTYYGALEGFWKTSNHPWINGGGASNAIIIDREVEARRLIFYGCDPEKVARSARILSDNTTIPFRRRSRPHKKEAKRVLGIVAPVYYEHGLCKYETIQDILSEIVQLGEKRFDKILISLHPKMDIKNYSFLTSVVCEVFHSNIEKLITESSKICIPAGSSIYADVLEAGVHCCIYNPLKLRFDVNYEQFKEYGLCYSETRDELLEMLVEGNFAQPSRRVINVASDCNIFKKIVDA